MSTRSRSEQQIASDQRSPAPGDAAGIVKEQARKVTARRGRRARLGATVGILLALYSAAKGTKALIAGLNIVYDEDEKRGFIRLKLISLGLTLA